MLELIYFFPHIEFSKFWVADNIEKEQICPIYIFSFE